MSGHKSTIKASKYLEKAYLLPHRVGTELGRMGKIIDEAELEEFIPLNWYHIIRPVRVLRSGKFWAFIKIK